MIKTRLIRLLAGSRKFIFLQVLWQWMSLLLQIMIVFQITGLVGAALGGTLTSAGIASAVVLIVAGIAGRFVCDRLTVKASYAASLDVKCVLREKIYQKLLRLGAAYRDSVRTAEVVQLAVEGVEQLETYFGKYLSQLFYSLLAPLTLFVVLFRTSWQASLVLLLFVPLIPLSIVLVQKIAKRIVGKYLDIYADLGDSFLENLQGLTTLKIYQSDEMKSEEMDRESERFRKITMKVLTMQLNSTSIMDIMAYGGAAAGMIVVLMSFLAGEVTLVGALTVCLLASEFFIPLRILGSFFHIAMNGMAASDKIFALLDLPEPEEKTDRIPERAVAIDLDGVDFAYSEDRQILHDVHVSCPAGGFVALVGQSGCGKSTVAGLLMGRNKGYHGSIRLAGHELSGLAESSIMGNVTMVTNSSLLFKGTVRDNLLLGKPEAGEDELWAALAKVQLDGFVREQGGLDMRLEEQAGNLSGGQRQRLAIARALLRDTPVYIFDEATSNIDVESEELIMDVIRRLAGSRTVVMITHRLANAVPAERIYVLQAGRVAESGTHGELMAKGGVYCSLYTAQRELEEYGKGGRP